MIHIMFSASRGETSSPALPPRPQQERGKVKRQLVYEAAVRGFAQNGFNQARIEDVVADAGVSWGTFFRYFPRKEDVLLEMGVEHYRKHVLRDAESGLDGQRPVRATVYAMFAGLLTSDWPSHLHGAMLREISTTPVRFAALLGPENPPWISLAAQLIAVGQGRGEVRTDVDAVTLAAVVSAGCLFPAIQAGYADLGSLRSLRGLPEVGDPIAILDRAFPVAWRGAEP
jgi:AcrR family transcriptional regulator